MKLEWSNGHLAAKSQNRGQWSHDKWYRVILGNKMLRSVTCGHHMPVDIQSDWTNEQWELGKERSKYKSPNQSQYPTTNKSFPTFLRLKIIMTIGP